MTHTLPVSESLGDPIDPPVALERPVDDPGDVIPAAASDATREDRIRSRAHAAAERRGFAAGSEVEDWLQAEREVDAESAPLARSAAGA